MDMQNLKNNESRPAFRILILEDNTLDAELIKFELRKAGFAFSSMVVETQESFIEALRNFSPDIILSDYDLPGYSGDQALACAKKNYPEIPFILVTGAVTEERAIEVLTSGARDYVLKHRLDRLAPAVRRALEEVYEYRARKKAEHELIKARRNLESKVKKRTAQLQKEIAERMRAAEQLKESEIRYRLLFENMRDGFFLAEPVYDDTGGPADWRFLDVNEAWAAMTGFPAKDAIGKLNSELFPGVEKIFYETVARVAETGEPENLEAFSNAMGRWYSFRLFSPRPCVAAAIVSDITERRREEEETARRRQLLQSIFDNMPVMLVLLDSQGRFVLNRHTEKVMGWTKEEADKGNFLSRVYPDKAYLAEVMEFIETGKTGWREWVATAKNGERVPLDWANLRLDNDTVLGIGVDLRERKAVEAALKESEERFRVAQELSPDGFTILRPVRDEKGRIVDFTWVYENAAVARMNGTDPKEVIGRRLLELFPGHRGSPFFNAYRQVAETGRQIIMEARYQGETIVKPTWFRIVVVSMGGDIAVLAQDITGRKTAEEEFLKRTAELEYANKGLESFSCSVSHDLRAPLRAIDGYSRILLLEKGKDLDNEAEGMLRKIRDSARKMDRLINDLLNYSRSGCAALSQKTVDMDALTSELWNEQVAANPGRRMELKKRGLPKALVDEVLIRQALSNLIANAVKFTRHRDNAIIEIEGSSGGREAVYSIRDNGAGFDMKYYDRLFGVFRRLHSESEYEGTGVGLAIVQRIIHRHGGRIWAEGKPGKGAEFHFSLPAAD